MLQLKPSKWCTHCRKHDHDDSECWCTRVVAPTHPSPDPLTDGIRAVAERRYGYPRAMACTVKL